MNIEIKYKTEDDGRLIPIYDERTKSMVVYKYLSIEDIQIYISQKSRVSLVEIKENYSNEIKNTYKSNTDLFTERYIRSHLSSQLIRKENYTSIKHCRVDSVSKYKFGNIFCVIITDRENSTIKAYYCEEQSIKDKVDFFNYVEENKFYKCWFSEQGINKEETHFEQISVLFDTLINEKNNTISLVSKNYNKIYDFRIINCSLEEFSSEEFASNKIAPNRYYYNEDRIHNEFMKNPSTIEYITESFNNKNLEIYLILNEINSSDKNITYKELMDKTKLGYYKLLKKLEKINKTIAKYKNILNGEF